MAIYPEIKPYEKIINYSCELYSVDQPLILASIIWQESRAGLILTPRGPTGTGDGFHGRGISQIDDRWNTTFISANFDDNPYEPLWQDPIFNIMYAAKKLRKNLTFLQDYFAAVCAYNAGLKAVQDAIKSGVDPDGVTRRGKYGKTVWAYYLEMSRDIWKDDHKKASLVNPSYEVDYLT